MLSSEQLLKEYSIRVSSRAKYMRLTISLEKGLVVVVPKSMNQRRMATLIPEFVRDKQQWLNAAIEKLHARRQLKPDIEHCQLPEKISLIASGHIFSITYCSLPKAEGSLILRQRDKYALEISGAAENKQQVFVLLEAFFKDYARTYLKLGLDKLSHEFNLPYNRLTIRAQKTRWGSCSSKKNINLNYRLLFIEKNLLDYILLHELVHTVHMNHSKAFWLYFESLMPDARRRDKQVNQMGKNLPCWIFHK